MAPGFPARPFPQPCSLRAIPPPDLPALCPSASNAQYIVSGSDDGSFFVWEKETTNLVRVLQGDESIVNCLQPHPSYCFLATSGIDPVVRLWNPRPEVRGRAGWQQPSWEERSGGCSARPPAELVWGGKGKESQPQGSKGLPGRSSLPRGPSCIRAGASEF